MTVDVHSYRGGLREGVAFLLLDLSGRVLLECRPDRNGELTDIFYPSGSIELRDHTGDADYRKVALLREIEEEFRGGVRVERVQYLGEVQVPEIGLTFYTYWIASWSGDPGEWTWEDGARHARLRWVRLDEVSDYIAYESGARMTALIRNALTSS
jgi:8-oxo-dGTP pyrophosphatase MutT (NUDIX family)